ncbi:transcriptional regulator BolA [Thalassotalea crassostreae]|uniref:transcriptional regulator BolA n=1 Tax=Thalassotalea crassostreae TaxID=1763536 RepID=UPI0008381951|nr:transcriptional regulator BolA [Thalassotalea crassostreae]
MSVADIIEQKLKDEFSPIHLEVINESFMHNVPEGSESHFKVVVVSEKFDGLRLLPRHRMINEVLADELANSIHALAMHTYTEKQWLEIQNAPQSPNCMGGGK